MNPPHARRQRLGHHAAHDGVGVVVVVQPEDVAHLVGQHRQEIDPPRRGAVHHAGGELGVVPRGRVEEPAVPGRVRVEVDDRRGRQPQGRAGQGQDLDIDIPQPRGRRAAGGV